MQNIFLTIISLLFLYLVLKPIETAFYKVFKLESFYEKILSCIRNKTETGAKYLFQRFPKISDINFQQGTMALHIRKEAFTKNIPMFFETKSRDGKVTVRFIKSKDNVARFEIEKDGTDIIARQQLIAQTDIVSMDLTLPNGMKERFEGVFLVFTWNIKGIETNLYVSPR